MTRSLPPLLALTGELPVLLRDQSPALIEQLRRLTGKVGAIVIGAEARPLQLDPVAVATALTVRVPGLPLLVDSDGIRDAPYNAARRFLSLDHLSGARAGVVFRSGDGDAGRTAERIQVIRALWSSWPAETLVADRERGVYATTEGIRRVEHEGAHYRVAGPLNSPTSRQGEPVSIWRVASEAELLAAVGLVDIVVVDDDSLVEAWRSAQEDVRPALAARPGAGERGASFSSLEAVTLEEVRRLAEDLPDLPGPAGTLRARLGLPPRAHDLSDKPLAFGAAL